jgi:hypothetical protein
MKLTIFIFLLACLSCSEDNQCKNYFLVTESSERSARDKCQGLANSHPELREISRQSVGCLTESEVREVRKGESTITQNACSGVSFTMQVRVKQ